MAAHLDPMRRPVAASKEARPTPLEGHGQTHRALLSRDTDPEAEVRQIEVWRRLSSIEIAELVAGASRAARAVALAGLRARYPQASDRELIVRLAAITLGRDLARRAYPELGRLDP